MKKIYEISAVVLLLSGSWATALNAQTTTRFYLQDFGNAGLYHHGGATIANDSLQKHYNGTASVTTATNTTGAAQNASANNTLYSYNAILSSGSVNGVTALSKNTSGYAYSNYQLVGPINGYVYDGIYAISQYTYDGQVRNATNPAPGTLNYAMPTWGTYSYDHTTGGDNGGGQGAGYNANTTTSSTTNTQYPGLFMYINANPANSGRAKGSYFELPLSLLNIPGATYTASLYWRDMDGYNQYYSGQPGASTDQTQPVPAFVSIDVNTASHTGAANDAALGATSLANFGNPAAQAGWQGGTSGSGTKPDATATAWYATNIPRHTSDNKGTSDKWNLLTGSFTLTKNFTGNTLYFNVYNSDPGYNNTNGNDLAIDDVTLEMQTISSITGTVYDGGGSSSTAYGGSTPLYAVLADANGKVIQSVPVASDGTYTFSTDQSTDQYIPYATGNIGMKIMVSTTNPAAGTANFTNTLPADYSSNGYNYAGNGYRDTSNATIAVTQTAGNIASADVYLNQRPVTNDVTNTIPQTAFTTVNAPAGYRGITLDNAAFVNQPNGTDAEDGTISAPVSSIQIGTFGAGTLVYYNGSPVTPGTIITGFDPSKLTIYASDDVATASFNYSVVDQSGAVSATPGTFSIDIQKYTVSGSVVNDGNGVSDNAVSGAALNNAGGSPLYAYLTDQSGNIVASQPVGSDGTYSFTGVNTGDYKVSVSTTVPSGDITNASQLDLPSGWVNSAQKNSDGSVDNAGNATVSITSAMPVGTPVNVALGLDQTPVTNDVTNNVSDLSAFNIAGTDGYTGIVLSNAALTAQPNGTDAEDGNITPSATAGSSIQITSVGADTKVYYDGIPVNPGTIIPDFDASKLVVYISGTATTASFQYSVADQAGAVSSTPGTFAITIPHGLPVTLGPLAVSKAGNNVLISWSTLTEINTAGFDIERSTDNRTYASIGSVAAQGNSTQKVDYSFTDVAPAAGYNYYRLKINNTNGTFDYSPMASIDLQNSRSAASIYPNPVRQTLHLVVSDWSKVANVALYSAAGTQVFNGIPANGQLDMSKYAAGLYYLEIKNTDGTTQSLKAIKL